MRLCAFDIDNTLLPRGHRVLSKKIRRALNALLRQGDVVCIASGRPFVGVKQYLDELGPGRKYAIVSNGAGIYSNEGQIIDLVPLTCQDVYYFQKQYGSIPGVTIYAYGAGDILLYFRESYFTDLDFRLNKIVKYRDFSKEDHRHDSMRIEKIMIAADPEISRKIALTEEEKQKYFASRSHPSFYEILALGASKGAMVEKLRVHLGIKTEDVYAFGDNNNDLTMIERFYGVAPANATEEIKKAAQLVTKDCREDGVAYAIRHQLHLLKK